MKQCNKCNEVKELDQYHKCSRNVGGLVQVCKKCRNDQQRAYRIVHADKIRERKALYYLANKEKFQAYHEKNKPRILERQYARNKKRYHLDPAYRLSAILRGRLHKALNGNAKAASTLELLGCTAEHARFHIESQFTEGMTWENIHVDHIQPCASFDLEDPSEQRKCFHYSNLQPLFASDNLRKSDKIVPEHQVRLL